MDIRIPFVFFSLIYQELKIDGKIMRYKFFTNISVTDFINLMYVAYFRAI